MGSDVEGYPILVYDAGATLRESTKYLSTKDHLIARTDIPRNGESESANINKSACPHKGIIGSKMGIISMVGHRSLVLVTCDGTESAVAATLGEISDEWPNGVKKSPDHGPVNHSPPETEVDSWGNNIANTKKGALKLAETNVDGKSDPSPLKSEVKETS